MKDMSKMIVVIVGMLCLTALEIVAMFNQLDGTYFAAVVGAITTVVGFFFGLKIAQKESVSDAKTS